MMPQWRFYAQHPTDPIRNPISGEFFSTEAVGHVTDALVREGIQNSLDARVCRDASGDQRCRAHVRIYLSGDPGSLEPLRARRWFDGLWPHVLAPSNGLREPPDPQQPCGFIVFEDFGTSGLTGDPNEYRVREGERNNFLNFFRAEGHSDKGQEEKGIWGVGKTVFPRASRIGAFFGLTTRVDDGRRLLLGRSILKYHTVNQQPFKSDGYFGESRAEDGFVLPVEDGSLIETFRVDFAVTRSHEPGLSLVVPYCSYDDENAVTRDGVVAAVLRGFFYPILMGHLAVTVAAYGTAEVHLDGDSVTEFVRQCNESLARELLPLIELAEWAQTRTDAEFVALKPPDPHAAQKWSMDLFPPGALVAVRETLERQGRIAIRVPMTVQARTGPGVPTFFCLFLERCGSDGERPVFIRDELIIPDVRPPRVPRVRSLVVVGDKPIAGLLRDAETPAHTHWSTDTRNFKDKYKFGPTALKFVTVSVSEVCRALSQAEQLPDPTITIGFFSVPMPEPNRPATRTARPQPRQEPGSGPDTPETPDNSRRRRFRVEDLPGGFRLTRGHPDAKTPRAIDIQAAYDVRRGNPLSKYNLADFDLGRPPIKWHSPGGTVRVVSAAGRRMRVAVQSADFRLDVTGFDSDRDLYVKAVVAKEDTDVGQEGQLDR